MKRNEYYEGMCEAFEIAQHLAFMAMQEHFDKKCSILEMVIDLRSSLFKEWNKSFDLSYRDKKEVKNVFE